MISVILLASSAQFLIAAMTPYAVTTHLCLNLVWLWLFLRDRWWGHLAAVLVAFVASGLHQVAFHPLFAAPFVFSLLFTRRWSLSVLLWRRLCQHRLDPLLTSSRKVLNLTSLRSDQIKQLCSRYQVAIFDSEDASRAGLPFAFSQSPSASANAERLRSCTPWVAPRRT